MSTEKSTFRFARSVDNSVLFGVLGGLGYGLGVSVRGLRIVFALLSLFVLGWTLVVPYLVLALLLPKVIPSEEQALTARSRGKYIAIAVGLAFGLYPLIIASSGINPLNFLGAQAQVALGVTVVLAGIVLLFSGPAKAVAPETSSPLTESYGAARSEPVAVGRAIESRSKLSWVIRTMLAAVMVEVATSNFDWVAATVLVGSLAVMGATFWQRHNRIFSLPAAVLTLLCVAILATGVPITRINPVSYSNYTPKPVYEAPLISQFMTISLYTGTDPRSTLKPAPEAISAGFGVGKQMVYVHAPDDAKINLDARMSAGSITVQTETNSGEVLSSETRSGIWTTNNKSYGNGERTLDVKVRGGVGELDIVINRSPYRDQVCTDYPGGSYSCVTPD